MTREEAIQVLNMVEAHGLADEAKRMAIESLSEPTIDVNKVQTSAEPRNIIACEKVDELDMLERMYTEQNIANGEVSVSDMAGDLVSRKILIGAIEKCGEEKIYPQALIETIKALPSAVPPDNDWCEYSDRLWKLAYERGKADRPKGEWIENEVLGWKCSRCGIITNLSSDFCPHCGAKMK